MKTLPYYFLLVFLFMTFIFSACENDTPTATKNVRGTYVGTVTYTKNTHRVFPDNRDTLISQTETFEETIQFKKTGKATYKVMEWESGCKLRFIGIPGPCDMEEFRVSDTYEAKWEWTYDYENTLTLKFDPKNDELKAIYHANDGYYTYVTDDDTGEDLYHEIDREDYVFEGFR